MDTVVAVGSAGTNVNTGAENGAIAIFEKQLQRSVQWQICMLHFNELPFRHVLIFLDGATTGPQSLCGPIGKALQNCTEPPIISFEVMCLQICPMLMLMTLAPINVTFLT